MKTASLSQQAYDRIESLIVTTQLTPGSRTTLNALEQESGFGRTPVHDAVKRLATARLILVQPRSGLRIAPIDLEEERLLLPVRIEMEAIACKLAAQRATEVQMETMRALLDALKDGQAEAMSLTDFNLIDQRMNAAILEASNEILLGNTLSPLQTLYRRSGWLFHVHASPEISLKDVIGSHSDLLRAITQKDSLRAERIVRAMLASVYAMLEKVEKSNVLARFDPAG